MHNRGCPYDLDSLAGVAWMVEETGNMDCTEPIRLALADIANSLYRVKTLVEDIERAALLMGSPSVAQELARLLGQRPGGRT